MNARTSWSAKPDPRSGEYDRDLSGESPDLPLDDLLEARFDEEGRLAQIGRGARQRIAERLDPRPPAMSAEELDRAVQKLSQGLEAIERQSSAARLPETRAVQPRPAPPADPDMRREGRGRDFVTSSLDRLEARLESLSKRLQQRASDSVESDRPPMARQPDPAQAVPEAATERPPLFSEAEAGLAALDRDVWQPDPTFAAEALAPASRNAAAARPGQDAALARSADDQEAETERRAEAAEAGRLAAEAEARRLAEVGEARRQAEAAAEAEARRQAEIREARRHAELDDERRLAEAAAAEQRAAEAREAEDAAEMQRRFVTIEARIETLQQSCDRNQIEPVRNELLELLREIEVLGRDGRSITGAVEQVHARLDQVESKINASRNMTGNRLGELQDRLSGLTERLGGIEAEIPGFDAVRENQTAILERFDRIEGMVQRSASPEELLERIDALKRHLQAVPSQREVMRIEEQILQLAGRLDSLPEELGDRPLLGRIEGQLQSLAAEFVEARRQRGSDAAELDQHLAQLSGALREIRETSRAPDISPVEALLSDIAARLDDGRRLSRETLTRLDERLAALTAAVERQESDASGEILAGLTGKMDSLAEAIGAQDIRGTRRDLQVLDRKLDDLSIALSDQAEHLSRPQMAPLEERLDHMQAQLEEIVRRTQVSAAQIGPFAQKLQEISERVSGMAEAGGAVALSARLVAIEDRLAGLAARGPDSRALHNQLESIVSRLELLKGRSIDPARLTDLFDRVDTAIRTGGPDDRLGAREELPDERFARLERKLEEIGQVYTSAAEFLTPDDLADLRSDIVALRRELRSMPGLDAANGGLAGVLRTVSERLDRLPEDPPATAVELENQIERIALLLDNSSVGSPALAQIEESLRSIEARLEDTRRLMLYRAAEDGEPEGVDGDIGAVAGLARALSDDVSVLKNATAASDRKTKDALEAVQDTLEAVVKRMAFLERDADLAAGFDANSAEADGYRPGPAAQPLSPARAPEPELQSILKDLPEASAAKPEASRETPPAGGLFSRFTSSQLIKRATGGRADSFSPDLDDGDEAGDLPLEPGTDAPLNSALAGAPSSDTALMSGARTRAKGAAGPGTDLVLARSGGLLAEPAGADDFLAAARRAAQAATEEAAEAERDAEHSRGLGRITGLVRTRRRAALAAVLALAVAVAALQIVRNQTGSGEIQVAAVPERAAPAEAVVAALPERASPEPQSSAAPAVPAEPVPTSEPPQGSLPAAPAPPAPAPAAEPERAAAAPAAAEIAADPAPPQPAVIAAVPPASMQAPAEDPAAAPSADDLPTGAAPALHAPPADIPAPIGPERLRQAAMAGDPIAAFEVAARYAEGRGVVQDIPAAVAWYKHAAEAGLAPAQYRLGSIYEKGLGVPKDPVAAQDWYGRAAEAGNVKAMHNLAVLYAEGAGGQPDLERAAGLFRQAAEHGVRDSQFNLAILHARGLGVPQDMLEAYKWFAIAASSGDPESLKRRDIIAAALSKEDLAAAEAAAAEFQPLPLIAEANDVMMPEGGWGEDVTSMQLPTEKDLVALVQMLLAEQGYDPGPADGLLGEQTIQAITKFQEQAGLPATGEIDTGLVTALQEQST